MEVLILSGFLITGLLYLYARNSRLKDEMSTLDSLLRETLNAHERELQDHKESVQELAVVSAKLEGMKHSTLTPENSIPKDMHVVKVLELSSEIVQLKSSLEEATSKFEESRGKQISERTRLGQTTENFAAFFTEFPYDRKEVKALFQPVDLIYFGDDEIVFIDVKTGASTLSTKQRKIRDNILNGKVRFEIHQLDENGYTIKKAE